jgi:transposase-like protein
MNEEQAAESRRVIRHFSAEDRERLIREQAASGLTKKAFCKERGIHVSTFHYWNKERKGSGLRLARVEVRCNAAPVEIGLADGQRLGLYIYDEGLVVRLLRGVFHALEADKC